MAHVTCFAVGQGRLQWLPYSRTLFLQVSTVKHSHTYVYTLARTANFCCAHAKITMLREHIRLRRLFVAWNEKNNFGVPDAQQKNVKMCKAALAAAGLWSVACGKHTSRRNALGNYPAKQERGSQASRAKKLT